MKEATGELNMTVVIVMAIAILSVFFFGVLWPTVKNGLIASSKCSDAVCDKRTLSNGVVQCKYFDSNGRQQGGEFSCAWKG